MDDLFLTFAVIAVALLIGLAAVHNGLALLRQDVRDAWGDLDRHLRRRYDLLQPLIALVRSAGETQPVALSAALTAKNQAAVAFNPQQLALAEATLTASIRELFDQSPPALTSDPAFIRVRSDLLSVASAIDQAAQRHNDAVDGYNTLLGSFPHDVAALVFGFKPQPRFEPAAAV